MPFLPLAPCDQPLAAMASGYHCSRTDWKPSAPYSLHFSSSVYESYRFTYSDTLEYHQNPPFPLRSPSDRDPPGSLFFTVRLRCAGELSGGGGYIRPNPKISNERKNFR